MADISIIIPVRNGEKWIDQCMESVLAQSIITNPHENLKVEIVVFNDGSTDKTHEILKKWADYCLAQSINFVIVNSNVSKGVGAAKNGAVAKSSGEFLCFQDIDDVMLPNRLILQWRVACSNRNALIGSKIIRKPINSTPRFVKWANNLKSEELKTQIYTSNGPTLLMPTWFCHKSVYHKVGGFNESGQGTPEDLIFFYEHLDRGGELIKIDEDLVIYTYHEGATTVSIDRKTIWDIQIQRLERNVLPQWQQFTIWNAGKCGRKLVRSLKLNNLRKIEAFCDVDPNKIGRVIELYNPETRSIIAKIPVIHFSKAKAPLLICVKLDLTNGEFEKNLKSLNLNEGTDYILFS